MTNCSLLLWFVLPTEPLLEPCGVPGGAEWRNSSPSWVLPEV